MVGILNFDSKQTLISEIQGGKWGLFTPKHGKKWLWFFWSFYRYTDSEGGVDSIHGIYTFNCGVDNPNTRISTDLQVYNDYNLNKSFCIELI